MLKCCSFLDFGHFSRDRPHDAEKLARWDQKWRQVGHLSLKLAKMKPKSSRNGAPDATRFAPLVILAPGGRPGAPNHAWSPTFQGSDILSEPILDQIFIMLLQFFSNFQHRFCTVAALRAQIFFRCRFVPMGCLPVASHLLVACVRAHVVVSRRNFQTG